MLDFYIIEDEKQKPQLPGQLLKYAGGLDDKTFDNLQRKGIIDKRFDYYSDFRWGKELVEQLRQRIGKQKIEKDTDVQKLMCILNLAELHESGLIAYGD
jgi:hypothetical protein